MPHAPHVHAPWPTARAIPRPYEQPSMAPPAVVAPLARDATGTIVTSITGIDATEVFPGLWQGGLHQFASQGARLDSVRPTQIAITDVDRAVVLAPDVCVHVVSPPSKVLEL